ncbi:gluconolactonase [Flavobacterium akiainvivens]|uniref:Gluconolactonase n=1 Tax=Flavobacterium akiainvivens TaxID=1202724 RepID=A0A0N0RR02_9FLAO|nr:L-dopachrome tautomerase-related protein [Flavobacterium akiainvivens]KOS07356.1 gluconolactonase [Flavobacterium akiainvivens]SFQ47103.1 Major royal jelly protein [Flavobacterium akiainvivens]
MKNIILTILITTSAFAQNKLEAVGVFEGRQPIGVAVDTESNRVFVSFPHNEPFKYGLAELGKIEIPYPDEKWNHYTGADDDAHFYNVQDLYADDKGYLWVLDSKPSGGASVFGDDGKQEEGKFKLVKIKLSDSKVEKVYRFGGLNKVKSGLNDVRVDTQRNLAYLSDPAQKAIVVLDLATDTVRLALQNHASTTATPGYVLNIDGVDMKDEKGNPFKSDVNGIALTKDNKYFYYKPINHNNLYRIETQYLADATLSAEALGSKVETVADVGVTHGLECDAKGNIYFGDSPNHSIKYVSPNGKVHTLVKDSRIIWPDSFGIGSNGYVYFSCAQLNRLPKWNNGKDRVERPFRVYRVKMVQ